MRTPAHKGIIVGLDGASMELVKRMVDEGHCPNIAKLMDAGVHKEMVGVMPTMTPPGWTTLATGAWPGTHKIQNFGLRNHDSTIDDWIWGINTDLCRAEYLWNTAERCGKQPILVKYEMSWPPTVTTGIQVEGTGPGVSNHAQIAGYHLFVTDAFQGYRLGGIKDDQTIDPSALASDDRLDKVALSPAEGWAHLPDSALPPLETDLLLRPLARGRDSMARGTQGVPITYYALVYAADGDVYDTVLVAPSKDASQACATLKQGEWSNWWAEAFEIDDAPIDGSLRCKLITLSGDAQSFELFFPQIWPIRGGYTFPEEIAQEIYDNVGPFLQNPARDAMGLIDDDTYFEVLDYHFHCLGETAIYLMNTYGWDLLFTETHATDYCSHFFLHLADPISGADPETVARAYAGVVRTYQAVDRWIGRLMTMKGDDVVLALVSDHGGTPDKYRGVSPDAVLEEAGLLVYKEDDFAGGGLTSYWEREIDWSKTKAACLRSWGIWINLEGREPEGIVPPEEYEAVQEEIIDTLYEYRDPVTGKRPFAVALTKNDAETINLWGDLVGDVVWALKPEFDGAHGRQLSSASLGMGSQHCVFVLSGAGVKPAGHLSRQVRQVDVAPTISYLIGMDVPRDCEGAVVWEALENPSWHLDELARLEGDADQRN